MGFIGVVMGLSGNWGIHVSEFSGCQFSFGYYRGKPVYNLWETSLLNFDKNISVTSTSSRTSSTSRDVGMVLGHSSWHTRCLCT